MLEVRCAAVNGTRQLSYETNTAAAAWLPLR
jgi:hypothetical protein